jgi:flavin reductase (DIM6/NTAB) family NADH-FMN oxidoreductase RutF
MPPFDLRDLRNCLGTFVTGVTIVTTLDAGGSPVGITANSFSSVSLEPPLVLWSQALSARSFPTFRDADRFIINILAEDQAHLSKRFAQAGEDKFANTAIRKGIGGLPIIDGCSAFLECVKEATYPGGDHAVQLGRVENFERTELHPLAFHAGRYMVTRTHDLGEFSVSSDSARLSHVDAVRIVTGALRDLSRKLKATIGLAVWGNHGATVVAWEPAPDPLTYDLQTGLVVSPLFAASGLVFSAFLPPGKIEPQIERELSQLRMRSAAMVPTREEIEERLKKVRADGVSQSMPERLGADIMAYGSPIFDGDNNVLFALTAVGRNNQIGGDAAPAFTGALRREADALSAKLVEAQRKFLSSSPRARSSI